jgi:cytidylate kinase
LNIRKTLSNNPLRRALQKLADLRKQEVGDVVADVVNSQHVRVTVQKRIHQVLHVQRMVSEGVGKALGAARCACSTTCR